MQRLSRAPRAQYNRRRGRGADFREDLFAAVAELIGRLWADLRFREAGLATGSGIAQRRPRKGPPENPRFGRASLRIAKCHPELRWPHPRHIVTFPHEIDPPPALRLPAEALYRPVGRRG